MTQICRTFVVRRALDGLPFGRDILAHSGLLLLAQNGRYYLVERLVGDTGVGFKQTDFSVDRTFDNHQLITMCGMKWTKQLRGETVDRDCTVDEARVFLEAYTREINYDPRNDNCHSAQEHLRIWLGQSIPEDRRFTTVMRDLASWIPAPIAKSTLPN